MFGNVWRWAGQFRQSNKNIGVDWYQIPVGLRNLLGDANLWVELDSDSHVDITVRFHHRLVQIHPFPNGNGRHARLMADPLLENVFEEKRLSWGAGTDLSKTSDIRRKYIRALQAADELDYKPLIAFAQSWVI